MHLPTERRLLSIAAIFLTANIAALSLQRPDSGLANVLPLLVWVICAGLGHSLLNRHLPDRDVFIFPLVMFLSGWGIIIIDRLAPLFADRQTIWLIFSFAALMVTALFPQPLRWLKSYRYILLVSGLVLLVSTIILGRNPSGQAGAPQLWLGFGSIFFQPSEALKVILVSFLASYLAEQYTFMRSESMIQAGRSLALSPRIMGPIALMWGLSVVVLVWQRDLGTAALFFIVFLILLYVASGQLSILIAGMVLAIIAGFIAYNLFAVVELRVDIWLNPWPEADGRAYQIVQSLQAFAAGGVFGQGINQGLPTFIPVVHSDFIFSALAEEWGLLGVITVIACLTLFIGRGFHIAVMQQGNTFQSLLAIGLTLLIGVQSIMIMGGVIRLLPLTGVTLPYVSYGGSSLLMSFVIAGLLLRLSANQE